MARGELPQDELEAAVEARRELGPEMEAHIVEGFLDRVGKAIDERVDMRVQQRAPRTGSSVPIGLPLGTIALGIPITGAAGGTAGLAGIIVAWIGIALINVAYVFRR